MDKAELLSEFQTRVAKFERFQSFIEKAQSQAGKFAAAVVEKVIQDNHEKSMEVVGELIPLMADMETVVEDLTREREQVLAGAQESQFKLEELELRHAIGDLTDESFEQEAAEPRAIVETTDARVAEIDEELGKFQGAMEHWQGVGLAAGVLSPPEEEEPEFEEVPEVEELPAAAADDLEVEAFSEDVDEGAHVEAVSIAEDVSVVFDEEPAGSDGFDVGDLDILGDEEEIELEAGDVDAAREDDKPRRAVLLYQEGTAEEQIYPFTGEVLSLGRGRDNDVQVKNDSKVSRYHCKLYRRGPNFYIEDNKSANGTLVNGELITERRLFGGEEVIIGETFFRFRILD